MNLQQLSLTHHDDGTPVHPGFLPSPAFAKWMETIPKTAEGERRAKERMSAEEAERAEKIDGRRMKRIERMQREEAARAERALNPSRGWGHVHDKPKHVVVGRIHLMEDDDRERRGYATSQRFILADKGSED